MYECNSLFLRPSRVKLFHCSTIFFLLGIWQQNRSISVAFTFFHYRRRNDRAMIKQTQTQTSNVIRFSIHIEVVPQYRREEENREKKKNLSCRSDILHPLSPPLPYFWRITFTPLLQLAQHFRNTVGLG